MPVRAVRPNKHIHESAGKLAFVRGPVVYCAEGVDNGGDLAAIRVDKNATFELKESEFMLPSLKTIAYTQQESDELYEDADRDLVPIPLTLIPYYAFSNRGESEMRVWFCEK